MTDSEETKPRKPRGLRRTARVLGVLLRITPKVLVACRLFRAQVYNRSMLDYDGRLIIVANHRSKWDPFYLWVPQSQPTMFVAKAELWKVPVVGRIMRALGHVPVDRKDPVSRGNVVTLGQEILLNGGRLIVFFEGTTHQLPYNGTTNIGKTYDGAAMMAIETDTPVLACGMYGTSEVGNVFTALFRRPSVRSHFSKKYLYPADFLRDVGAADVDNPTREEKKRAARRMTDELEGDVSNLVYAAAVISRAST